MTLVKRLRASHAWEDLEPLCGEAADEIARLTEEVERLEADRNDWKETAEDGRREYQEEHKFWRERSGVLKAKAHALAEAATQAAEVLKHIMETRGASLSGALMVEARLRTALTAWKEGQREVKDAG